MGPTIDTSRLPAENAAPPNDGRSRASWLWEAVETLLILLVFALVANGPPPDVGEAHYLAKAKHYWNPAWCKGDLFLESADAHLVFYWAFGWTTQFLSLPMTAYAGRAITWLLLAWSWRRLSFALAPRPLLAVLTGTAFLELTRRCHLAGEWIIGGVEAKGFAYAFVLFALAAMVKGRWTWTWLLLGAATSFHVLVGGWSLLAVGGAWLVDYALSERSQRPPLGRTIAALIAAFVLALPGLAPALALTRQADPQAVQTANEIYVFVRLPHHLVFHLFGEERVTSFCWLAGIWMACTLAAVFALARRKDLRPAWRIAVFVICSLLFSLIGVAIDYAWQSDRAAAASLLRYYWHRLADIAVPLGAALAVGLAIHRLAAWKPQAAMLAAVAALVLCGAAVWNDVQVTRRDPRSGSDRQTLPVMPGNLGATLRTARDWRAVCEWVGRNTPPDARVLTPRTQQTFKWIAGRAETATWKDVPQDAETLLAWWRQFRELHGRPVWAGGFTTLSDSELLALAQKYDFQYIVVERRYARRRLGFPRIYPAERSENLYYDVFAVKGE